MCVYIFNFHTVRKSKGIKCCATDNEREYWQIKVPVWAEYWAFGSTWYTHGANINPCSLPAQISQTL